VHAAMHDVFISYKSEEYEEASWVRDTLEENGIACWMAPASIPGGSSYAEQIPVAIHNCKLFVLILSARAQASRWVKRELDMALNEGKTILPFLLENFVLSRDFTFYLGIVQRYDAVVSRQEAMAKMLREIKVLLEVKEESAPLRPAQEESSPTALQDDPAAVERALHLLSIGEQATAEQRYELGTLYENGEGLPRSLQKAMECYEAAAEQDHMEAKYRLALCYLSGERKSKGVNWLTQAAEQGHTEAQYRLGICYLDGIGVNENEDLGIRWLSAAGQQGYLRASFRLGQLYENRCAFPGFLSRGKENYLKAIEWYARAAAEEDPEACYRLGRLVQREDYDQAMNHYRQAAEQQHPLAQYAMAQLYFKKRSPNKAVDWLEKAALLGLPDAQYELAVYYREGTHSPTDFVADPDRFQPRPDMADYWMEQAAEGGHGEAQYETACRLAQAADTVEKALQLLQYAAGKGHQNALCALALCHKLGNGVPADPAKARELLEKNADHPASMLYLAGLYAEDPKRALRSFDLVQKAAQEHYVPAMLLVAEDRELEKNWVEAIYWYGLVTQGMQRYDLTDDPSYKQALHAFYTLRKKHRLRWLFAGSLRKELNDGWYRHFLFRDPSLDIWVQPLPRKPAAT